jgi:uncharacterized integral membrane protein (TIGR00697 family)
MTDRKSHLYLLLSAFFVGNAFLAELTGAKIFSAGDLLTQGDLTNAPQWLASLNMSVGVLIWPLVFITSDIMNEYFGREGVRKISFITAILITYALLFLMAANALPPASFWLENNRSMPDGSGFDINYAYRTVLGQSANIIIGSLTAFLVSQLVDAYTFHYIKKITNHRHLWLRATGSTVISQVIDSFLIVFVAFYLLGNWSVSEVIQVASLQYAYKVGLAILLTPVIYGMHWIIDRYLRTSAVIEN